MSVAATYMCEICNNTDIPVKIRSKPNQLICPNCGIVCCFACQMQYAKDQCMQCNIVFKHRFIMATMGAKFISTVVRPNIIAQLKLEQKEHLPHYQPLIEYEKLYRAQKAQIRFGIKSDLPPRPSIIASKDSVFPCPVNDCRGYVTKGACITCLQACCMLCHEKSLPNHVCNLNDLTTIGAIKHSSKPCPQCSTAISRSMGCNHMHCTNCGVHFDWETLKILTNSTNHHYRHLQTFAAGISYTKRADTAQQEDTCQVYNFSLRNDHVPLDRINQLTIPKDIIQVLYRDSNTIRLTKLRIFNEEDIVKTGAETYEQIAVGYLMGELTEEQWGAKLYNNYRKIQLKTLYATVINIYLDAIDKFQLQLTGQFDTEHLKTEIATLVNLCNDVFTGIQDEYGGAQLKIRNIDNPPDLPAIII